jgi:hypothetical protein
MTEKELTASDEIDQFLAFAAPKKSAAYRLELLAKCWDVLRMVDSKAGLPGPDYVSAVDFQVTEFVFGPTVKDIYAELGVTADIAAQCTLDALRAFANVTQLSPEDATQDVLLSLIADAAVVATAPPPAPLPPSSAPKAKPAPAVVSSTAISRLFKPAKFTPNSGVTLVSWESQLPTGLGPQLAGLVLNEGETDTTVLLETGEIHEISNSSFLLARTTDPADYEHAPVELLAYAAALPARQSNPPFENLGKFTHVVGCGYDVSFIEPLVMLFKNKTRVVTAAVSLPFDGSPYRVTLEGGVSTAGPYVTAKLIDEHDNVIMRLNTPRLFSPRGVYLFPVVASNTVYALVIN